jgi:hypothetical protein
MTTLLLAAVLQPGIVPFEPNLRRYANGDRWVYTIQIGGIPLHTMAVDLVFVKELGDRNVFEARTTAPRGGSVPDKDYSQFVLFAQYKLSGDAKFLDIKGTSAYGTLRGFKDATPSEISGEPGAVIHPGRWDNSPKPASSVAFITELHRKQYLPYVYIGKETVDTGFASIECAVYEAKAPDGGTMKYWFNPRIGNYIKAITSTAGVTTIAYLKETNILSK